MAEDDSDLADQLWDAADLKISSHLIYPEAGAALAAASRAGRISKPGLRQALADLEAAVSSLQRVGVDEELARAAGRLAAEHALRGYDAVHLATALSIEDHTLVVVTWGRDLAHAALNCGRSVAPPLPS